MTITDDALMKSAAPQLLLLLLLLPLQLSIQLMYLYKRMLSNVTERFGWVDVKQCI